MDSLRPHAALLGIALLLSGTVLSSAAAPDTGFDSGTVPDSVTEQAARGPGSETSAPSDSLRETAPPAPAAFTWLAVAVLGMNIILLAIWVLTRGGKNLLRGGPSGVEASQGSHDTTLLPLAVTKTIDVIEKRYAEDLSLSALAKEVQITPNYLGRLFRESTGKTVVAHLNQVRVEKAAELMRTTNLTVADIHPRVGISHASYFAKVFREWAGMTPSEYLKEHRTVSDGSGVAGNDQA